MNKLRKMNGHMKKCIAKGFKENFLEKTLFNKLFLVIVGFALMFIVRYIIHINFAYYWTFLHTEMATDLAFVREARNQRTLFPQGWLHLREVRLMHLTTPILLVYLITGNLHLSYPIASTIMLLTNISLFYWMLSYHKMDMLPKLVGLIVLLMFFATMHHEERYPMFSILFINSSYALHLSSMLFIIGSYMRLREQKRLHIAIWILAGVVSFAQGFQSDRLLLALFAPLFLVEGYHFIVRLQESKKDKLWGSSTFAMLCLLCSLAGAVLVKYLFRHDILITYYPTASELYFVINRDAWGRIGYFVANLLFAVGILGGRDLFTVYGVLYFGRLAAIIILVMTMRKIYTKTSNDNPVIIILLLATIFSSIVMAFVSLEWEITSRYLFPIIILFSVMAAIVIDCFLQNKQKIFAGLVCFGVLVGSTVSVYALPLYHRDSFIEDRWRVVEFIREEGLTVGYGSFWQSEVIAAKGNFDFNVMSLNHFTLQPQRRGVTQSVFYHEESRVFLITTGGELARIQGYPQFAALAYGERHNLSGGWVVVILEQNPWQQHPAQR